MCKSCCDKSGAGDFLIQVGDRTLTHFHPAGYDFHSARLRAFEHAARFAGLRSQSCDNRVEPVETLEWEPVETVATQLAAESDVPCCQNVTAGADPAG